MSLIKGKGLMEKITLKVADSQDISFEGRIVARQIDPPNGTAIEIYETAKGNWFLAIVKIKSDVLIYQKVIEDKSQSKLIEELGFRDISKSIYEEMDIDTTKKLDI